MKLHLPTSLRAALLAAIVVLAPQTQADTWVCPPGTSPDFSSGGYGSYASYWHVDNGRSATPPKYEAIFVIEVTGQTNTSSGTYRAFLNYDKDGAGADYSFIGGGKSAPAVWFFVQNDMDSDVHLTNYGDILVSGCYAGYIDASGKPRELSDSSGLMNDFRVSSIGYNLRIDHADSFTYKDSATSGDGAFMNGGSVDIQNVKAVNFSNNQAGSVGGLMRAGTAQFSIATAESVTFSKNKATNGSIIYDTCSDYSTGGALSISNVTGKVLFDSNEGGLLRNASLRVAHAGSLEVKNNKGQIVYGYNCNPELVVEDVRTVSFTGNGTAGTSLFESCTNISFKDCGSVAFSGNTSQSIMFGIKEGGTAGFTNVGNISLDHNTLGNSFFDAIQLEVKGVSGTLDISDNKAQQTDPAYCGGLILKDGNSSLTVTGGSYSAATDSCTGMGDTVEISRNSVTGEKFQYLVANVAMSVSNFQHLKINGNSVDNTKGGMDIWSLIAPEVTTTNVANIELKDNTSATAGKAGGLFYNSSTFTGVETLTVSGNSFTSERAGTESLLGKLTVTGASSKATVSITGNSIVSRTLDVGTDRPAVNSLSNLASFVYSSNSATAGYDARGVFGVPSFSNVKSAVFSNNTILSGGADKSADGSIFITNTHVTFSGVSSLEFSGNKAAGVVDAETNPLGMAGSVYGGVGAMFDGAGLTIESVGDLMVKNNTGLGANIARGGAFSSCYFTMQDAKSVTFSGNKAQASMGGEAGGGALYFSYQGDNKISGNGSVVFSGNSAEALSALDGASDDGTACGGAIYCSSLEISGNGSVRIEGNNASASHLDNVAGGGVCADRELTINESDFVSRGNYVAGDGTAHLNGLYCGNSQWGTSLSLNAQGEAGKVAIYDGAYSYGALVINEKDGATGTVLISGEYAKKDLAAVNPKYTAEDLELSCTVSCQSIDIRKGTLALRDGAILKSAEWYTGFDVNALAKLDMRDSALRLDGKGYVSGTMAFGGHNTVSCTSLTLENKSSLCFTIGSASSAPLVDMDGDLVQSGALSIILVGEGGLKVGTYKLLSTTDFDTRNWTADNVSVSSNLNATFADLYWQDNTLYFNCTSTAPEDGVLTWREAKGVWQVGSSVVWDGISIANDKHFHNGDKVLFNKKATVTINGEVAPDAIRVEVSGKDAVTFSGKGSIVGGATLAMNDTGILKLNAANAYTGGTVISAGTVTATGNTSFGTGDITLNGGTLNLGGKVVENSISASGGTLSGAAKYAGTVTVEGAAALNGNLLAKQVLLNGGTLTGGTIKDTAIALESGTLASAISGKSSVLVTGEGSLTGKLSYTGGTTLAGGKLTADFTVAAKQTLAATTGTVGGNLTLGGGSLLLVDKMELSVSDSLVLKKASTLDVSSLNGTATISFASLSGDTAKLLKLSAPTEGRKSYAMEVGDKAITVTSSGSNTDLTWNAPKGKWEVVGTQQWEGSSSDNRFYHGDNVTFNSAATVTLATKLAPGSVTVTGNGAVTFSGSGSIAGDAALTMSGSNTLKLNATNTYTGGTTITNGTVLATGVDSFGKGDITLSGGTLNLGKKAVKNSILVDGSATILNAKGFAGTMTVDGGTLALTDSLTGTLVLSGGTLDLTGVKNVAKMTFGNVVVEDGAEVDIVDAKGNHYTFEGNKLVKENTQAAPVQRQVNPAQVALVNDLVDAGAMRYTTRMGAQMGTAPPWIPSVSSWAMASPPRRTASTASPPKPPAPTPT